MDSDHCPITFNIKLTDNVALAISENKTRYNFAKADWVLFRKILEDKVKLTTTYLTGTTNIDELNEFISDQLIEAVEICVPKFVHRSNNSLPIEIVDLIKIKRVTRKALRKLSTPNLKTYFNKLTSEIKTMIKNYRENRWASLLDKFGPYPVSSRLFWQKINQARANKQSGSIRW